MKIHHNTMFSDERFSGSEDTIRTKHRHMDRQTVIPIYPPNFVNRGRGGGRRITCNTGWSECMHRHRSQGTYRLRFYRDSDHPACLNLLLVNHLLLSSLLCLSPTIFLFHMHTIC